MRAFFRTFSQFDAAFRGSLGGRFEQRFGRRMVTLEDAEEKLEFDLYYVKHMSLLLDVARHLRRGREPFGKIMSAVDQLRF